MEKQYIIIDLKSFYASVECVERRLDPLTARLVGADKERGKGTICLAVSPALKKLGIKNRCRLFDVPERLGAIVAEPRMQLYIDYAAKIYGIYLRYFAPEDIEVYSIDEAFMEVTPYLWLYGCPVRELAQRIINYREEHGGFANTEELMQVEGIGEGRYAALKNRIVCKEVQ